MAKQKADTSYKKDLEERRFGVILEDINSKFELILEGHAALDRKFDKRMDGLEGRMDKLEARMNKLEVGMNGLETRMGGLETRMDGLESRVARLEQFSKQILEYLSLIDNELQELKKRLIQKADLERVLDLEKRIAKIELVVQKHYGKN